MILIKTYYETLKQLLTKPRQVIEPFVVNGVSDYTHPFKFFLIAAIIVFVIVSILVDFPHVTAGTSSITESVQAEEIALWIEAVDTRLSTQFLSLMLFLLIPFLSLSGLIFFRNETDGFYSLLILNSYVVAVSIFTLLIAIPFWGLMDFSMSDPLIVTLFPALLVSVVVFGIYNLYFNLPGINGILKKSSVIITGYLLFLMFKGLFSGVGGYMIFAINRIREISGAG